MPSHTSRRGIAAPAVAGADIPHALPDIEAELRRIEKAFAAGVADSDADALLDRETALYAAALAAPVFAMGDIEIKLHIASYWNRAYEREVVRDDYTVGDMVEAVLRGMAALFIRAYGRPGRLPPSVAEPEKSRKVRRASGR